ncbi:hypothetical protein [Falsihalocynthiibacter sp. CO-5D18]
MIFAAVAMTFGLTFWALKRGINAPVWMIEQLETRLNANVIQGVVAVGGVRVELLDGLAPDIVFTDVVYLTEDGRPMAQVDRVHAVFAESPMFSPELLPRRVALSGAKVVLRRDRNGAFNLQFGGENAFAASGDFKDVIRELKSLFEFPFLSEVEDVSVKDFDFELIDDFSGRTWNVSEAALVMNLAGGQIDIISSLAIARENSAPATMAFSLSAPKSGLAAQAMINVQNVRARDVALQSPALSWLGVLEAPISGALRTELLDDGSLGDLNGTLEIGAGALQPTPTAHPIPFSEAKAYFSYDPKRTKISFDLLQAKSDAGEVLAEGFSYLQDWDGARPGAMVTQLQFSKVVANPGNLMPEPAVFDGGALDFRLKLDPFVATIGQLSLTTDARKFLFDGEISAPEGDWDVRVNTRLNTIDHDSLLALWPVKVAPRTRKWLMENVTGGLIYNVVAAIRKTPGEQLRASLGYEFSDATVRYLKTFPPVKGGNGYVSLTGKTMTIAVNEGHVLVPNAGSLDVAGTVISMPDVTLRPAPMEIEMLARGEISTALSLLDLEPFRFVSKSGQNVEIAQGTADILAKFSFDIVKKVQLKDVTYDVTGKLLDVTSTSIVPSKILTSEQLDLHVTPESLRISGPGRIGTEIDKVAFNVVWEQLFGPEHKGNSKVTGDIEISQEFVRAFGLGLPRNMLSGAGIAQIEIDMQKDTPPRFSMTSDLNRLGISLPEIGWSNPKNSTGTLAVSGVLGSPAQVESLELTASGLTARGKIEMSPNGGLKSARFDKVRLGKGLDVGVNVVGRGAGRKPEISVVNGTVDLRSFKLPSGSGGGSGGAATPLTLRLDRLVLSNTLSLTDFKGDFSTGSGITGKYTGLVNGQAAVSGTLAPSGSGTAIRMRSSDAGAVLRAAGLYKNGHSGAMDLVLAPRGPAGHYSGRLVANDLRIRNAPGMASLLGAISVVGLLDQLEDSGLLFNEVVAEFVLTPERLTLMKSSAVGASMGISLSGAYEFGSQRIAMKGVLSPLYVLNGIGSIFTQKGEGLFGFNFSMTGTATAPKISVNPFSILTPGMFRDIFNGPPPKAE